MKREDGVLVSNKKEVKGIYSSHLFNTKPISKNQGLHSLIIYPVRHTIKIKIMSPPVGGTTTCHVSLSLTMFTILSMDCRTITSLFVLVSPSLILQCLLHPPLLCMAKCWITSLWWEESGRDSSFAVPPALGVEEGTIGSGHWLPYLSSPFTESCVCGAPQRTCATPGCRRIIGNLSHDPHRVCISCDALCSVDARCTECFDWPSKLVDTASEHQHLQWKWTALSPKKEHRALSLVHSASEPASAALAVADEVAVSQWLIKPF